MDFEVENFDGEIDFDDDDGAWNKKKSSNAGGKIGNKGKDKAVSGKGGENSYQSSNAYNPYATTKPAVSKSLGMFGGGDDEDDAYDFAIDKTTSNKNASPLKASYSGSSSAATAKAVTTSSNVRSSQDGVSTLMDAQKLLAKYSSKPASGSAPSTSLNRTVSSNQIGKSLDISLDSDDDDMSGSFEYSSTEGLGKKKESIGGKNKYSAVEKSSKIDKFSDLTKKVTSSAYLDESADDNSFSASLDAGLHTKSVANIKETFSSSRANPPQSRDFVVEGDDDDEASYDDDDDDDFGFNTKKSAHSSKQSNSIDGSGIDEDSVQEEMEHSVLLSPDNKADTSANQGDYGSDNYEEDYEDDAEVDSEYERMKNQNMSNDDDIEYDEPEKPKLISFDFKSIPDWGEATSDNKQGESNSGGDDYEKDNNSDDDGDYDDNNDDYNEDSSPSQQSNKQGAATSAQPSSSISSHPSSSNSSSIPYQPHLSAPVVAPTENRVKFALPTTSHDSYSANAATLPNSNSKKSSSVDRETVKEEPYSINNMLGSSRVDDNVSIITSTEAFHPQGIAPPHQTQSMLNSNHVNYSNYTSSNSNSNSSSHPLGVSVERNQQHHQPQAFYQSPPLNRLDQDPNYHAFAPAPALTPGGQYGQPYYPQFTAQSLPNPNLNPNPNPNSNPNLNQSSQYPFSLPPQPHIPYGWLPQTYHPMMQPMPYGYPGMYGYPPAPFAMNSSLNSSQFANPLFPPHMYPRSSLTSPSVGASFAANSDSGNNDSVLVDLLKELKLAREDASWAKQKLAEMLSLIHKKECQEKDISEINKAKVSGSQGDLYQSSLSTAKSRENYVRSSNNSSESGRNKADTSVLDADVVVEDNEYDENEYSNDFETSHASIDAGSPPPDIKKATFLSESENSKGLSQRSVANIQEISNPIPNNNTANSKSSVSSADVKIRSDEKTRLSSILSSDPSIQWDLEQLSTPLSASQLLFRRQLQSLRNRLASTSSMSSSSVNLVTDNFSSASLSQTYPLLSSSKFSTTPATSISPSNQHSNGISNTAGFREPNKFSNSSSLNSTSSSSLNEIKKEFENRRKSNVVKMLQLLKEIDPAIDEKRGNELIHTFLE